MLGGEVKRMNVGGRGEEGVCEKSRKGGSGEYDGDGGEDEVVWWGWSE